MFCMGDETDETWRRWSNCGCGQTFWLLERSWPIWIWAHNLGVKGVAPKREQFWRRIFSLGKAWLGHGLSWVPPHVIHSSSASGRENHCRNHFMPRLSLAGSKEIATRETRLQLCREKGERKEKLSMWWKHVNTNCTLLTDRRNCMCHSYTPPPL